jgi:hypothetical protein
LEEEFDFKLYSHSLYEKRADEFVEKYKLVDIVFPGHPKYEKKNLKPKALRVCRFCGLKADGKTTFRSDSHLLSEMIGNKELFTDFECDSCNNKYSLFENDLANYLGISRTVTRVASKNGIPSFKSAGKQLVAKSKSYFGNDIILISTSDLENGVIDITDRDKGILNIKYIKNPFVPSNVFKTLLKWALSVLHENVTPFYTPCFEYLKGKIDLGGAKIYGYRLSFNCNLIPRAYIFKKRNVSDKIMTHVIAFGFQDFFIYVPIPFFINDHRLNGKEIEMPIAPPFFTQFEPYCNVSSSFFMDDVCSNEKKRNVEEILTIQLDPEDLKNTAVYDYKTDSIIEQGYKSEKLKCLLFTRDNLKIKPEELHEFVKSILEGQ